MDLVSARTEGSREDMMLDIDSTERADEKADEETFLRRPSRRTSCTEDATMM